MLPSYADKLFPAQTRAILLKVALDDVCDHVEATEEQGQPAVQTHSVLSWRLLTLPGMLTWIPPTPQNPSLSCLLPSVFMRETIKLRHR